MIIPQFERIRAVANTPVSEVIHVARVAKRGRQAGVSAVANAADNSVHQRAVDHRVDVANGLGREAR